MYFFECLPDYLMRYRFGRTMAQLSKLINEYEGNVPSRIPNAPKSLINKPLAGLQSNEALDEISALARDDGKQIIGVCGACGVGKTEVVANFCRKARKEKLFEHLFWVEASFEDDLQKLQMKIASQIDVTLLSVDSVQVNSTKILEVLNWKKIFLLVLDNLWKPFSLEDMGIPPLGYYCWRSSKIIITCRSFSLCRQIKSSKTIALKLLSDGESYELMKDEIGLPYLHLSEETQSILENVAGECGGLPMAIILVARHLRRLNWNDRFIIERALKMELVTLRESTKNYIEDEVFATIMHSFEQLKYSCYSCIQECFLYCTMYPRNHGFVANELMEYWIWEELLGEVERIDKKLEEAEKILEELKDACLIESIGPKHGVEIVKMHPLFWDMAARINKERARFFSKAGIGLIKPLYKDWPEDVERVSLMTNNIGEFRCGPNFSKLSTLLLQNNPIESQLPNDFFEGTPNLKILDLSNTGVHVLPKSLSCLKNLNALLLRNCHSLKHLPSLLELVALLVLDISGSPIAELPCDVNSKIIRLGLSQTRVNKIPHSLLTKLNDLQELLMIGCDFSWLSQSLLRYESVACTENIQELKYLTVLEITFAKVQVFQGYISSGHGGQLKRFKFCVGGLYNGKLGKNSLAFIKEFPSEHRLIPFGTSELLVMHCGDVTDLKIPRLQYLKIMDVSHCAKLKYLFKIEVLQNLENLEEMVIAECRVMEKVIEHVGEGPTAETITLPSLKKLTLFNLPQLQHFFSNSEMMCDSMQTIAIWNCSRLQTFPIVLRFDDEGELETPRGLKVRGEEAWLENLKNCPSNVFPIVQPLFNIELPPEELISRGRMMGSPSDLASSS